MIWTLWGYLAALVWGTAVGVDLVSFPQAMIARPVVAGTVAGWLLGDPLLGLRVGVVLELFALDVLPIGASRYPDYGPATVAAVAAGVGHPWEWALGVCTAVGLAMSLVGRWSLEQLRRRNALAAQAASAALSAGDAEVVRRLHLSALGRDAVRSLLLTGAGLLLARLLGAKIPEDPGFGQVLSWLAIGGAIAAVIGGAVRSAAHGRRLRWLLAGFAGSLILILLR